METVPLSATGERVSAMCLGTDYYGSRVPPACAFELLDQFSGAGGMFLDTSNLYASWIPGFEGGESERVIGDWMAARRCRDRMFVGTKVGFPYQDSPGGLRASEIARECERSLRRLKSDSIDLYFTHRDDRTTPLPEILEAFTSLVKAGKVRFVGISNWHLWRLAEARLLAEVHHLASPAAVELRHTYLRPQPGADFGEQVVASPELLDYCRSYDLSLLAYSVLLNGAYSRGDRSIGPEYQGPDSSARLSILHDVANETGATPNQVVIASLLNGTPAIIAIIGGTTREQLAENLQAADVRLTPDQMARLQSAGNPHPAGDVPDA